MKRGIAEPSFGENQVQDLPHEAEEQVECEGYADISDEDDDHKDPAVTFDSRGHTVFHGRAEPSFGENQVLDLPHEAEEQVECEGYDGSSSDGEETTDVEDKGGLTAKII